MEPEAPRAVPPSWAQGRATFGGLVTALALRALREQTPPGRAVRSLLVSFVSPLAAERPVDIEVIALRYQNQTHLIAAAIDDDGDLAIHRFHCP